MFRYSGLDYEKKGLKCFLNGNFETYTRYSDLDEKKKLLET